MGKFISLVGILFFGMVSFVLLEEYVAKKLGWTDGQKRSALYVWLILMAVVAILLWERI